MKWKVTFNENGGYDCISSSFDITKRGVEELIVVDGKDFGWLEAWNPAPPGTRERMEQVANAIADALNQLDEGLAGSTAGT